MVGTYSFARVILIINGTRIHGFGADDAISFADQEDIEPVIGADGEATISLSADKSRIVTVQVMPTSPSYRFLSDIARDHRDATTAITPLNFSLRDTVNGDKMNDANGIILNQPFPSKSKRVQPAEFRIFLPNPTEEHGALLTGQ